ncbi:hypothetical protein [Candidatus Avelusimicrobium fimicolum]|uniref:hypothetical protein n=1 Tax=Candidatus Avelusimicrobium fimicolum TaxID=3416216 RepID=UPI003D0B9BB7
MLQCFRLVKAGYGDLNAVRSMTGSEFIGALQYEDFLTDYQNAYIANKTAENK